MQRSDFFQTHEVIGSSLLFVHDRNQASIWLIDFAKTVSLPGKTNITHANEWIVGNHEDGYLIGINNLINIFEELMASESSADESTIAPENKSSADSVNATQRSIDDDCSQQAEKACELDIDAMKIDQTFQNTSNVDGRNQDERE